MEFQTIPTGNPELETPEDGQAIEINEAEVKRFVKSFTEAPQPSGTSSTPVKPFDNGTVTVQVRNASGVPGLAGQVLQALTAKGFASGDTANAESNTKTSVVKFGKGGDEGGAAVAEALGGAIETVQDNNLQAGYVRVFVGSDYAGPGARNFAGGAQIGLDGARQQPSGETGAPITADGVRCVN
jgi:hypothetical protein